MGRTPEHLQHILNNLLEAGLLTTEEADALKQGASNPEAFELILKKFQTADSIPPLGPEQYYREGTQRFELIWPLRAALPLPFDKLDRKTQFFVLFQEWARRELDGTAVLNSRQPEDANPIFDECIARAQQLQIGELIARSYEGRMRVAEKLSDRKVVGKWSELAMKARSENG